MTRNAQLARQISYASGMERARDRALVRLLEGLGGRRSLVRRAEGYEEEVAWGRDVWEVICRRFGIRVAVVEGSLETIPAQGPLVVVANHPFGILDGLVMARVLSARRGGDFRIMAHRVFRRAPEIDRILLPVDFDETREAQARNLETRAEALRHLGRGGAIGIFPGGTVSTAATPLGRPLDPAWRSFTARMIARSEATVVPLFFEGRNSRLFQVASHVHHALRLGLLLREFRARLDSEVRLHVGDPVPRGALRAFGADSRGLMAFLRETTYALSPDPVEPGRLGHEFEARYRAPAPRRPSPRLARALAGE